MLISILAGLHIGAVMLLNIGIYKLLFKEPQSIYNLTGSMVVYTILVNLVLRM